jgi:ABC-type dipeptide/oligopeptide/nickel transport system permease component
VVQGAIVLVGLSYILINLVVDLVVRAIDPRTQLATASA